jgi:hypothetical protein
METKDKDLLYLLPWYLNGTLDEASHRKVESLLQVSPAAQAEVLWLRGIQDQIRNDKDMEKLPPPDAGLDRLMAMIDGERAGKVVSLPSRTKEIPKWYRPALGIAAALVVAQAVMLGMMMHESPRTDGPLGPLTGVSPGQLQITFKSTATEPQIRATLALVSGTIVSGPGVIGVYSVSVPQGQESSALAKLAQQKDVIDSVTLRK